MQSPKPPIDYPDYDTERAERALAPEMENLVRICQQTIAESIKEKDVKKYFDPEELYLLQDLSLLTQLESFSPGEHKIARDGHEINVSVLPNIGDLPRSYSFTFKITDSYQGYDNESAIDIEICPEYSAIKPATPTKKSQGNDDPYVEVDMDESVLFDVTITKGRIDPLTGPQIDAQITLFADTIPLIDHDEEILQSALMLGQINIPASGPAILKAYRKFTEEDSELFDGKEKIPYLDDLQKNIIRDCRLNNLLLETFDDEDITHVLKLFGEFIQQPLPSYDEFELDIEELTETAEVTTPENTDILTTYYSEFTELHQILTTKLADGKEFVMNASIMGADEDSFPVFYMGFARDKEPLDTHIFFLIPLDNDPFSNTATLEHNDTLEHFFASIDTVFGAPDLEEESTEHSSSILSYLQTANHPISSLQDCIDEGFIKLGYVGNVEDSHENDYRVFYVNLNRVDSDKK